ncbi:MAG: methyltransferase, partial [Candidatus Rokubacteria bacterium]|nr:methyltransferase [Candidatus Rokubacteria bacterium]
MTAPITDVRDISRIGYGFMASRALFAALDLDVFGHLAGGAKDLDALARDTGIAPARLRVLLTACVSLGLLTLAHGRYENAPAAGAYLVRTSPSYFGDYFRFQIARQIYPTLQHVDEALRGRRIEFYAQLRDPAEARAFTVAQHSGSLGPAHVVAKLVDFTGCRRLLDVGGGSGAFSIVLCQATPGLTATIVDFPSVQDVGREFVTAAGLGDRVAFVPGDARDVTWPEEQDVVLLSYLVSAVSEAAAGELLR